jgi:Uncharacterized protein conserved in bacteria (DUF2252)
VTRAAARNLQAADKTRVPELVPIRCGRMLPSPFTGRRARRCAPGCRSNALDIWYARIASAAVLEMVPAACRAMIKKRIAKTTAASSSELVFPKLVEVAGAQPRIHDDPPLIFHRAEHGDITGRRVQAALASYRETLADDRRALLTAIASSTSRSNHETNIPA